MRRRRAFARRASSPCCARSARCSCSRRWPWQAQSRGRRPAATSARRRKPRGASARSRTCRRRPGARSENREPRPRNAGSTADMEPLKDASHLYEVEHRATHAARPGFRINELKISAKQKVPWHYHNHVSDTFYVVEGEIRIFMQQPKEEVRLAV